ncbi:hypothetical protein, partial [Klebsiella pneumoniae]|uniref:hypothetical protein n=1 Tax=Klebsiella pneumoniae TaxID=573 RepID=UPI003B987B1F
ATRIELNNNDKSAVAKTMLAATPAEQALLLNANPADAATRATQKQLHDALSDEQLTALQNLLRDKGTDETSTINRATDLARAYVRG